LVFGISGFLLKMGNHKKYHTPGMLFGLYSAGSLLFLSILLVKGHITLSPLILLFVTSLGIGSYYGNTFLVKAYDLGPACLTSPLISLNILFVILLSTLVYHETLTPWQLSGIGCMITAVALVGCNFKNTLIKSRLWGVFVALAIVFIFMREGGLKIAHEMGLHNSNIFWVFICSCIGVGKIINNLFNNNHFALPIHLIRLNYWRFFSVGYGIISLCHCTRTRLNYFTHILSTLFYFSVITDDLFKRKAICHTMDCSRFIINWDYVCFLKKAIHPH
jgi:drug/metabolite transporter (DMT)-like permease